MRELQIYADGIRPDADHIKSLIDQGITGFTCNPSLIKAFLPIDYKDYCMTIIDNAQGLPVSIQVLASDLEEMKQQASEISSWSPNVFVKIPIINEFNESCAPVIVELLRWGVKVNVTAIFSSEQVEHLIKSGLWDRTKCVLSVFSGRIADTGISPMNVISKIRDLIDFYQFKNYEILWAGVRSMGDYNLAKGNCDIITIPQPILDKLPMKGKDLDLYCLETVNMFARDSENFTL